MPPTPRCPDHGCRCIWQTGWGYPSWICPRCIDPVEAESDDGVDELEDHR